MLEGALSTQVVGHLERTPSLRVDRIVQDRAGTFEEVLAESCSTANEIMM